MDTALVVTWKVPFPGREKQALEFATEAEEHWGKLAAEGRCTPAEWYFLPDGTAMWIVKGERRTLEDLLVEESTAALLMRGLLLMDGWQYQLALTGGGAEKFVGEYAAIGSRLGLI